jgi:putative isomerase
MNTPPRLVSRLIAAAFLLAVGSIPVRAQSGDDFDKYAAIIKQHAYHDYKGMFHQPVGVLAHPFITPGSVYANQLWDWDSWLMDVALGQIVTDQGAPANNNDAITFGEGCVLNFLDAATSDGFIPILFAADDKPGHYLPDEMATHNMHKPVLAQHAAFLTRLNNNNAEWLRPQFPKLQAFIANYQSRSWNKPTGLYFWQDDLAIGVDNDPCTFFRPPGSSGSIFLNCLMYKELQSMAYLADCLKLPKDTADKYRRQADDLKAAIQENCWDERDGFYYSVDLNLLPITNKPGHYFGTTFVLHKGHPRDYSCLIQRIEVWSGFMAMWAGIATPEQAKRMVAEHLDNQKTLGAPYGVRSLSKMEKMYGLYVSGNPSNWHGPIWGISNYIVFRGLLNYGFDAEATDMSNKTVALFGRDYEKCGALHEYYNPDTGEPINNIGFQDWNYLVLNMIAWREKRAVVQEF